jgi:Positive regulator of sigma E activity
MLQNKRKIEHEGVIVRVGNDFVFVNIEQYSACADCHAKGMCNLSEKKEKIIEIPRRLDENYNVGDKVTIIGASSLGLKAVFYAFVLPLIIITLVLAVTIYNLKSESLSALFSILSLVVYYFIIYLFKDKFKTQFVFTLTKN